MAPARGAAQCRTGQCECVVKASADRAAIAVALLVVVLAAGGCVESASLRSEATMGVSPQLAAPAAAIIPTVNIAPAKGWPPGAAPDAAAGLAVKAWAGGLDHPRWLYVLPNGDVLVAETNAPPKPDDGKGIKGWLMRWFMSRAGAGVPSANRITLLRDTDGDGVADLRTVFLQGLNSPFGMVLVGGDLYVACTDALLRFHYSDGATSIAGPGEKIADLPAGTINHHWTKNVVANRDGSRLGPTAMRPRTASRMKWIALPFSRSIPRRGARASSPRDCATRTGWASTRKRVRCGPSSTSETSLEAISCPTT